MTRHREVPELPEVERARSLAANVAQGHRIEQVWAAADDIVFAAVRPADIRAALLGKQIEHVHRLGKHFWFELDHPPHLLVHFGMTGTLRTPGDQPLELSSSPRVPDHTWPPRFTKLRLQFEHGPQLAITNARRLGRILLRNAPLEEPPLSRLGFDALTDYPPLVPFEASLQRRRGNLKSLLLNQGFVAGLGNWLVDDILYQAQLAPTRQVENLKSAEIKALHFALHQVVTTAVEADAERGRYPRTWLFHRRWDARFKETIDGYRLKRDTVSGRTTVWVPARQR